MRGAAGARIAVRAIASAAFACAPLACGGGGGRGLVVVDGASIGARELDLYCGSRSRGGACVSPSCAAGEALDPLIGACVPRREVRAIVARDRPQPIPDGALVACREGQVLVAHADHAVCLAAADACPRATHWQPGRGCVPDPACPPGEARAPVACVRVVHDGLVDVGAWSRAVLGPDGGDGDARVCRVLAQAPWDFDVGPGALRRVTIAIDLTFPNNDVSQATATSTPTLTSTPTPTPTPTSALFATTAALTPLLLPLRALSRLAPTADAASATVRITCAIAGGTSPLVTQKEGVAAGPLP